MKQKISFNPNIYIEGMRQLRVTGIICVIVMAAASIIRLIGELPLYGEETVYCSTYTGFECTYTGFAWMPWLLLSFVLITPIMSFQMFQFMNKRNASDLFHSLPHTRGTIFISLTAAVMSWIIITILASMIPSLLSALFFSKYISFYYDTFFLFVLFCISASVLVGGAIMIAKSLSGTILNGIILTGILLFVPRMLLSLIICTIESNPIFDGVIGNSFTGNEINPVTGTIFSLMGIDYDIDIEELFIHVPSIIYGLVLGIIYFVIGGILFCRRNSETASQSAPSRGLQAVYRIIIALTISSLVVTEIFSYNNLENYKDNYFFFGIAVSYAAIVFVYFLYELITTRKLKNLVRAIPGLGIVAVLNVAMYFCLAGCYKSAVSFRPAPDEINSITVMPELYSEHSSISYDTYVLNEMGGLEIKDRQIIEDVSYSLNQNLVKSENSVNDFWNMIYSTDMQRTTIEITTNGESKKRNVYLSSEQRMKLNEALCSSKEFQDAWMSPPDSKDFRYINAYNSNLSSYTSEYDAEELYEMFCDEIKNADFQTWFEAYSSNEHSFMTFETNYLMNGRTYYLEIPVYEEATPKTVEKFIDISTERQIAEINETINTLNKLKQSGTEFSGEIYIDVYNEDYSESLFNVFWNITNSVELPLAVLDTRAGDVANWKNDEYCMDVNINIYNVNDSEIGSYGHFFTFPADEDTLEMLKTLNTKYGDTSLE